MLIHSSTPARHTRKRLLDFQRLRRRRQGDTRSITHAHEESLGDKCLHDSRACRRVELPQTTRLRDGQPQPPGISRYSPRMRGAILRDALLPSPMPERRP